MHGALRPALPHGLVEGIGGVRSLSPMSPAWPPIQRPIGYRLTRAASRPTISSIDTSTMDRPRTPGSFLPLPDAELEILIALLDGESHGYAIMRAVAERTEGRRRLGPGTLYTALKRLLAARLIEEVGASRDAGGEEARRRLYRLSHFGSRVLGAELDRLSTLVRHGRKRLQILPSGGRS